MLPGTVPSTFYIPNQNTKQNCANCNFFAGQQQNTFNSWVYQQQKTLLDPLLQNLNFLFLKRHSTFNWLQFRVVFFNAAKTAACAYCNKLFCSTDKEKQIVMHKSSYLIKPEKCNVSDEGAKAKSLSVSPLKRPSAS